MLGKTLAPNFTGTIELGFSKLCSFLNCHSVSPSDLSFTHMIQKFNLMLSFLVADAFEPLQLPIFFCSAPPPLSLHFYFKKGFSLSKTLYHALTFMFLTGHEVMRALPFTSVGRSIKVLE